MDDTQKQVVDRLKQANNILVTVRNDPTIDLLSACIGLALVLDKMDKHAAAVFSGQVPSAMEFLKPEDTIERTPDSLRDFIIALDKSKADKLRYKVEDTVVRIFITPYKTSLSEKDLEFSQGDFNVDAIVALGAHEQEELDQAITAHGRILHDAAIISINNTPNGNLGTLHWQDIGASSISEMVSQLVKNLGKDILDEQIATALLTGIVAETERFSNEKTTPETMKAAGELMAAGANQKLVATSLQSSATPAVSAGASKLDAASPVADDGANDGTLDIDHQDELSAPDQPETEPAVASPEPASLQLPHDHELLPMDEPHISNVHGSPLQDPSFGNGYNDDTDTPPAVRSYLVDEPAIPGSTPKRSTPPVEPSDANPFEMPFTEPPAPLLNRDKSAPSTGATAAAVPEPTQQRPEPLIPSLPAPSSITSPTSPASSQPSAALPANDDAQTLEEIEESVHSSHVGATQNLDDARNQVANALQQSPSSHLEPMAALGANPLGDELHPHTVTPPVSNPPSAPAPESVPIEVDADGNFKQVAPQPAAQPAAVTAGSPSAAPPLPMRQPSAMPSSDPMSPPPAPPPLAPPNFGSPH